MFQTTNQDISDLQGGVQWLAKLLRITVTQLGRMAVPCFIVFFLTNKHKLKQHLVDIDI